MTLVFIFIGMFALMLIVAAVLACVIVSGGRKE